MAAILAIVHIAFSFWAFYSGLMIRNYGIISDKIDAGDSVRVVVLSDLHSHIYGDKQQELVDMIKKQKPDIIALAGDIVDDNGDMTGPELFLKGIADIAPIYFVTGNHEIRTGKEKQIKEMLESYGAVVLQNEYSDIIINGVNIRMCGIEDPEKYKSAKIEYTNIEDKIMAPFKALEEESVNILLAHRPERIEVYKKYGFDLVLSGHAHGGQIRIPLLLNGLFAPDQGFFPKYAGGLYEHENLTHIVSRGIGYNPNLPRIFNPPEIVVVDIKGR